jgi:hypothetical protein
MSALPSLHSEPRRHIAAYERVVLDDASTTCADIIPHGLMGEVASDTVWSQLLGNSVITAGVTTIQPRIVPERPAIPADTASSGVWSSYTTQIKMFTVYKAASQALNRRLKDSLPLVDVNQLSHPVLGLSQVTSLQIMTHLRDRYGTLRAVDYAAINTTLETRLQPQEDYLELASRHRLLHVQLADNNQGISELRKVDYFVNAVKHVLPIHRAYELYVQHEPAPHRQSFAALITHLETHVPNFVTTSADMGYAAHANTVSTPVQVITDYLASPAFAAIVSAAATSAVTTAPASGPRRPNNRRGQRSQPPAHPTQALPPMQRTYCYAHGYDGHTGRSCNRMANPAYAADYTEAHRSATSHTSVARGSTFRL